MRRFIPGLALLVAISACNGDGDASDAAVTTTGVPIATSTADTIETPSVSTTSTAGTGADDALATARLEMVDDQIAARFIEDAATLTAMRAVPRHEFVPAVYRERAYEDHPLPIGHGQTISQPYIVALMTEALDVQPGDKVLEIGTGSGYQAAVLAEMGVEVYTIEIIQELAAVADETLRRLGYDVSTLVADGYFGWEEHAPFDAIIVTAAPDHVPQPLINQLASNGRLVIPVGPIGAVQTLWRFELDAAGEITGQNLGDVLFVPFTREEG